MREPKLFPKTRIYLLIILIAAILMRSLTDSIEWKMVAITLVVATIITAVLFYAFDSVMEYEESNLPK